MHADQSAKMRAPEDTMGIRLELGAEDAKALLEALEKHLTELRREVAATENPDFRHTLQREQNRLERILEELRRRGA
jgi:hypothetical protein